MDPLVLPKSVLDDMFGYKSVGCGNGRDGPTVVETPSTDVSDHSEKAKGLFNLIIVVIVVVVYEVILMQLTSGNGPQIKFMHGCWNGDWNSLQIPSESRKWMGSAWCHWTMLS